MDESLRIFVVNREKDIDRKEYIVKHFSDIGISDYEFFPAINGVDLSDSYIKKCRGIL